MLYNVIGTGLNNEVLRRPKARSPKEARIDKAHLKGRTRGWTGDSQVGFYTASKGVHGDGRTHTGWRDLGSLFLGWNRVQQRFPTGNSCEVSSPKPGPPIGLLGSGWD